MEQPEATEKYLYKRIAELEAVLFPICETIIDPLVTEARRVLRKDRLYNAVQFSSQWEKSHELHHQMIHDLKAMGWTEGVQDELIPPSEDQQ